MTITATKQRALILYAEEVRAVLANGELQFRRLVKPQPEEYRKGVFSTPRCVGIPLAALSKYLLSGQDRDCRCPFGKPGDRLRVKERIWRDERCDPERIPQEVIYDATPEWALNHNGTLIRCRYITGELLTREESRHSVESNKFWHRKSSTQMPDWASRITLELTDMRAEPLQKITAGECEAAGINSYDSRLHAITAFREIWDSRKANRKHRWVSNPWVWVGAVKRVEAEA